MAVPFLASPFPRPDGARPRSRRDGTGRAAREPATQAALRCEISGRGESLSPGHRWPLLAVGYGEGDAASSGPRIDVANRVLGRGAVVERWSSARPALCFRRGPVVWSEDGEWLAGVLSRPAEGDIEEISRSQFAALLDLVVGRGYLHLVRVWNYVPGINEGAGDREIYRRFNAGRARAFEERFGEGGAEALFCASSAVGTPGAALGTAFLATRSKPMHLENRRQVPASRYPRRYGPRAPSFSRATLAGGGAGAALFVSGTASIVGHETVHAGSLEAQIDETLRNLDAVIDEARRVAPWRVPGLPGFAQAKVYLRDARRFEAARTRLAGCLPTATIFLEADICRADLAIEIEGVALP